MNRLDYVDVAKGLGILFVVLGHCLVFAGCWSSNLFWYIYAFHMPFWFTISGYLYKWKDPSSFIIGRVSALLVPYLAYFSLNIAIYAILTCMGKSQYFSTCCFGAFWFLITLFFIVLAHYLLDVFLYSKSKRGGIIQVVVSIIALLLGLNYARYISGEPNQPIATAFVGYAFFSLGNALQRVKITFPPKDFTRIARFVVGLFLSVILFFTAKYNGGNNIDMNTSRYMNEILFVVNALLGIMSFSLISVAIGRSRILQNLGRNSLTILMIHIPVCKVFLAGCSHFGYRGFIPAILAVIISLLASYCAIWLFKKYMPFMLGKLNFD